jgi:hypothetical protein
MYPSPSSTGCRALTPPPPLNVSVRFFHPSIPLQWLPEVLCNPTVALFIVGCKFDLLVIAHTRTTTHTSARTQHTHIHTQQAYTHDSALRVVSRRATSAMLSSEWSNHTRAMSSERSKHTLAIDAIAQLSFFTLFRASTLISGHGLRSSHTHTKHTHTSTLSQQSEVTEADELLRVTALIQDAHELLESKCSAFKCARFLQASARTAMGLEEVCTRCICWQSERGCLCRLVSSLLPQSSLSLLRAFINCVE